MPILKIITFSTHRLRIIFKMLGYGAVYSMQNSQISYFANQALCKSKNAENNGFTGYLND